MGRLRNDLAFALLAFLLIVGVWNEYMMGSTVFKWIPTLIDSLIPFAIGVAEISIILSIERGVRWGFFSTGALYSIAFLAFWNMYRRAATGPGNAFVLTVVREYRYITLAACVSLGIVFLLAGFFNWWMSPYGAFVMLLCTALMLVRAWDYWSLIIRHARNQEILNTADVIVPPKSHE